MTEINNNVLTGKLFSNKKWTPKEDAASDPLKDKYGLEVIAHRGYSSTAPENTISAFEAAANNGFSTVECDVSWTKDEVPVILHDQTINRTARGLFGWRMIFPRKCSNLKLDELLKYDFGSAFSKEFKGEKIPTFEQTLECCSDNDLNLYIELKSSDKFDEKKAQELVDLVEEAGMEENVTWISFEDDYLKEISDIMPETRLGYLSSKKPNKETIKVLDSLKTDYNEVFLDVKASKVDKVSADMLHDAGYDFEAWTVDNINNIDKLHSYDCKGITTNKLLDNEILEYLNDK